MLMNVARDRDTWSRMNAWTLDWKSWTCEHADGKKSWDFNDENGGKKQRNRAGPFNIELYTTDAHKSRWLIPELGGE